METINITKEAAVKAYENGKKSDKKLLENLLGTNVFIKNVRDRYNTWSDILNYHNHTEKSFAAWCEGLSPDEVGYRKEKLIVAAYNLGKLPDWTDGTSKYWPRFRMPSPSGAGFAYGDCVGWRSNSGVGSRLVFVGDEAYKNMLDAVAKFLPEYKESRTL